MRAIADLYREQKMDCLYFTSDGLEGWMMTGGPLDEHLAVANFGSRPYEQLTRLRGYRPNQPAMCGEYWCGWFDHWFEEHHTRDPKALAADFEEFFKVDGSFSIYMFHGGTNFGFMNGANYQDVYAPTVTSYDYFAPLNEAGDRTEFYYHIRDIIGKYFGKEALPELTAKDSEKRAYGKVKLTNQALLLENLDNLAEPVELAEPKFMEQLDQGYGYILYRTEMVGSGEELRLDIESVHDRAEIFINGEKKATYERWDMPSDEEKLKVLFPYGEKYSFDILCENMGRVNYGQKLIDRKGVEGVRYNRIRKHFGWQAYRLTMNDLSGPKFTDVKGEVNEPTFLRGYLNIDGAPCDSFIKLDGFTKGFVVINGFNIGRYFNEAGPQKTLYVPAPILKKGENEIIVFESDKTDSMTVEFLDKPEL
jgi:beta-galactosidase